MDRQARRAVPSLLRCKCSHQTNLSQSIHVLLKCALSTFLAEPEVELFGGAKIVNVGGHFRGSSILWWQAPDGSKGAAAP